MNINQPKRVHQYAGGFFKSRADAVVAVFLMSWLFTCIVGFVLWLPQYYVSHLYQLAQSTGHPIGPFWSEYMAFIKGSVGTAWIEAIPVTLAVISKRLRIVLYVYLVICFLGVCVFMLLSPAPAQAMLWLFLINFVLALNARIGMSWYTYLICRRMCHKWEIWTQD